MSVSFNPIRRALAALIAAGVLVGYAPPRSVPVASDHCDHPAPAGIAWSVPAPAGDCHEPGGVACSAMPQCGTAPALNGQWSAWTPDVAPAGSARLAAAAIHGLPSLGPPTPPPNS